MADLTPEVRARNIRTDRHPESLHTHLQLEEGGSSVPGTPAYPASHDAIPDGSSSPVASASPHGRRLSSSGSRHRAGKRHSLLLARTASHATSLARASPASTSSGNAMASRAARSGSGHQSSSVRSSTSSSRLNHRKKYLTRGSSNPASLESSSSGFASTANAVPAGTSADTAASDPNEILNVDSESAAAKALNNPYLTDASGSCDNALDSEGKILHSGSATADGEGAGESRVDGGERDGESTQSLGSRSFFPVLPSSRAPAPVVLNHDHDSPSQGVFTTGIDAFIAISSAKGGEAVPDATEDFEEGSRNSQALRVPSLPLPPPARVSPARVSPARPPLASSLSAPPRSLALYGGRSVPPKAGDAGSSVQKPASLQADSGSLHAPPISSRSLPSGAVIDMEGGATAEEGGAEKIFVAVRVRPLSGREVAAGEESVWQVLDACSIRSVFPSSAAAPSQGERSTPAQTYHFDRVFDEQASSLAVYQHAARHVVLSVLQGVNGSGKTYTMAAVTEMAIQEIFEHIAKVGLGRENTFSRTCHDKGRHCISAAAAAAAAAAAILTSFSLPVFRLPHSLLSHLSMAASHGSEREYSLQLAAMEIYNEQVRDLLAAPGESAPLRVLDGAEVGGEVGVVGSSVGGGVRGRRVRLCEGKKGTGDP
ncbi:unnamed protein product [Closterium sp. NIES-53]